MPGTDDLRSSALPSATHCVGTRPRSWDRASWSLIALHTLLLLSWWPLLPFFVDLYYHLNVLQGFRDAGGVVLHAYWEWAPGGRPHLYPPALHIGLLAFDALHVRTMTLARLATIAPYPVLLAVTWWCAREWLGHRAAYWVTVCGLLPFSYLLVTCNTLAASWAMVLWLMGLAAAHRGARVACALCAALVFYTHLGTPWLMVCSWALLALMDASLRRTLSWSSLVALALSSPWLYHLWRHRASIGSLSTYENQLLELPVAVYLLAVVGAVIAVRRRDMAARWVLFSLMGALSLLLLHYRYRFFSGQGLLGISLLAGLGLTAVDETMSRRWVQRAPGRGWIVPVALTAGLFAVHPVWFVAAGRVLFGDTALSHLAFQDERMPRSNAVSFYYPRIIDPLVQAIRRETRPDELIGCNQPATCGLLAALSQRATTTGMLAEIRPEGPGASPLRQAHLIIWLKGQERGGEPSLEAVRRVLPLRLVEETEAAYVLRNPLAGVKRKVVPAVIPLWAAQALLGAAVIGIAADLFCRRRPPSIPV